MRGKQEQHVSAVFAALADPTRRRIIERLATGGTCRVTNLAKPFRMSLPAISRHLRVLEEARLIERERSGRLHLIRTKPRGLEEVQNWVARHAEIWERRLDALEAVIRKMKKEQAWANPKSK